MKQISYGIIFILLISVIIIIGSCINRKRKSVDKNNLLSIIKDITPKEFASIHIEKSINIDYSSKIFKDEIDKKDKDKMYLIYCKSGWRSKRAQNIMKKLGFKEVYNISGGIIRWTKEEYPVIK